MTIINSRAALIGVCLASMCSLRALAVPSLQLDIGGGVYDPITETTIAQSSSFTLTALVDPSLVGRTFYLSAAIIPNPGATPSPDFGSFSIGGVTFNSSSGMQFGTPPVDTAISDLPTHSVFPTWFAELSFSAVAGQTIAAYNVQDGKSAPGLLNYVNFNVDTSGLTSPYVVHFDLYSYDGIGDPKVLKIDYFAPFSHDAQSGSNVPDGGTTAILLGAAMTGLGCLRRKLT